MKIEQWIENISLQTFENVIERLPENLIIYGAGAFGKEIFHLLQMNGKKVKCFLDKNARENDHLFEIPIFNLQNVQQRINVKEYTVLFSIVMDRTERMQVIKQIRDFGFLDVIESQKLRVFMVKPDNIDNSQALESYYIQKIEEIKIAETLFADDKSLKIYNKNLEAHICRTYDICIPDDPMQEQYFPEDVPLHAHSSIIDCGAYIGDTVQQFLKRYEKIESYVAFEPNLNNFEKLKLYCQSQKEKLQTCILYPCAVSGKSGFSSFQSGTGSGKLDEVADDTVACIALDDVLLNYKADYIKMDIEGAELKALESAKTIISKNRPDLAICVYHNINHIWEIPLLLHSWNLGYSFYLRSYNAYTMETVLYATTLEVNQ